MLYRSADRLVYKLLMLIYAGSLTVANASLDGLFRYCFLSPDIDKNINAGYHNRIKTRRSKEI